MRRISYHRIELRLDHDGQQSGRAVDEVIRCYDMADRNAYGTVGGKER